MIALDDIADAAAAKRKALGLSQSMLAKKAGIGLSTLDALENHRMGELGFSRVTRILTALGLELELRPLRSRRPTLDELRDEESNAEGLDGRS